MGCAGGRESAILMHVHFSPRPVHISTYLALVLRVVIVRLAQRTERARGPFRAHHGHVVVPAETVGGVRAGVHGCRGGRKTVV